LKTISNKGIANKNLQKKNPPIFLNPLPILGDGAHLHLEGKKKMEEEGELKLPFCQNLAMVP
jgi:hypothetical protein